MKAIDIKRDQKIVGFGQVRDVHIYTTSVAVKDATPSKSQSHQSMGLAGAARLAAEAEEQCYQEVPSSVRVTSYRGDTRTYQPDDVVELVQEQQITYYREAA